MCDTKEKEFKNKLDEKEKIIEDQKNKIDEYIENIKLIQMEKDRTLRSFHDKLLDSMKQSSTISLSAVSPITSKTGNNNFNKTSRFNDENENTTAFDNQQCQENHEKTLDTAITTNDQQVENTGPTTKDFRLPQSSSSSILKSQKSNTLHDKSDSVADTLIKKAEPKSKPSSIIAPISAKLANYDADEAAIIIDESPNNDYEEAKSTESTNIVGILKRKTSTNTSDNKNSSAKKIRFASDVVDNEKLRVTSASRLRTYGPVKRSLFDSSPVKRNSNKKTNSKMLKKSDKMFDENDSDNSLAWMDDVFTFP
ncbi:hypothetical protein BLA29_006378 [Euroglyphus maynei]|uniref:Uncharacterized protein n=1 Tax=Euroglyphus maynei TaxID=6958 RepID=A0A1Y3B284_EURMA|nr:hypothetical protein BLA29_006378 [Euroglyphus maynei]